MGFFSKLKKFWKADNAPDDAAQPVAEQDAAAPAAPAATAASAPPTEAAPPQAPAPAAPAPHPDPVITALAQPTPARPAAQEIAPNGVAQAEPVVVPEPAPSQADAAAAAPHGPSLAHFVTVADLWRRGGALTIEDEQQTPDRVFFAVTRCRYVESYREMGLPEELVTRLSCQRDGAFAAGYSPCLVLSRPTTLAAGASGCPFTFTWNNP